MAKLNYGLLSGLAQGIEKGISSYKDEKDRLEKKDEDTADRELKRRLIESQIKEASDKANDPMRLLDIALKRKQLNKEDDPSDAQFKAAGFASTAEKASDKIKQLESEGKDVPGKWQGFLSAASKSPGIGGLFEMIKGEDQKSREQAQTAFEDSTLRDESGAVLSPSEKENERKKYFRQVGESDAIALQKAEARAQKIASLKARGGNAVGLVQKQAGLLVPKASSGLMARKDKPLVDAGPRSAVAAPPFVPPPGRVKMVNDETGETAWIDPKDVNDAVREKFRVSK